MIVPMTKYAFLVHHADYLRFLRKLWDLNVVDTIEEEKNLAESTRDKMTARKRLQDMLQLLERRQPERTALPAPSLQGAEIVQAVQELLDEEERVQQHLVIARREIEQLEPWGAYDSRLIEQLEAARLRVLFYTCPERQFRQEWTQQYALSIINKISPDVYFVVFMDSETRPELAAEEIPRPEHSLSEWRAKHKDLLNRRQQIRAALDAFATHSLPELRQRLKRLNQEIEVEQVMAGTAVHAANQVRVLKGFVPHSLEEKVQALCEQEDVVWLKDQPTHDDAVPILLENNRFARLFEPIGTLFAFPKYAELDLTPFFAPFFMLFFGFCLGDAGYGIVLLLGASLYRLRAKPELRPLLALVQFLGIGTVIFGILTGTVFGLSLLDEQFASLGAVRTIMLDTSQTFNLALMLGVVQIFFALALKAANQAQMHGCQHALPAIGWIVLLLSLGDLALVQWGGSITSITAWLGVALILFFSDPKAGILRRIGKGLWDLYGITGFFGDLLSYIRLFALGVASAILGFVINDIALQMKEIPGVGVILFVVFLLIGHTANLLISSLGAFVHPMRLTFVEFYKNAGFAGGGKAYKPFGEGSVGDK